MAFQKTKYAAPSIQNAKAVISVGLFSFMISFLFFMQSLLVIIFLIVEHFEFRVGSILDSHVISTNGTKMN